MDLKNYSEDDKNQNTFFVFCKGDDFLEKGTDAFEIHKVKGRPKDAQPPSWLSPGPAGSIKVFRPGNKSSVIVAPRPYLKKSKYNFRNKFTMKDIVMYVKGSRIGPHLGKLLRCLKAEIIKYNKKHKVYPYVTSYTSGIHWVHFRLTKRKPKMSRKLPAYKRKYEVTMSLQGQNTKKTLPNKLGLRWLRSRMEFHGHILHLKSYKVYSNKRNFKILFELQDASETRAMVVMSLEMLDEDGNYPVRLNGKEDLVSIRLQSVRAC